MLALHGQYWIPSDDIDGMARVRIMSTSILAEKKGIFKIDIMCLPANERKICNKVEVCFFSIDH